MQKIRKIIETILVFIVIMLLICLCISLYNFFTGKIAFSEIIIKTGLYFLYTIGYGALEGDAILQNILAIIGIVALALMSTFLTINLFWRLDDVILVPNILYDHDKLVFTINNKGRTICNIQISYMLYDATTLDNLDKTKEYYVPMLVKKTNFKLNTDLNETFWYKSLYGLLTDDKKKLYCILSFTDTKNGQNSIKVQEFTKSNLSNITYEELVKPLLFSHHDLNPIENGGQVTLKQMSRQTELTYNFNNIAVAQEPFVMTYYNFNHALLNLEKYNHDTTYLEVKVSAKKELNLTWEVKTIDNNKYSKTFNINSKKQSIKIYFKDINFNLEKVNEICFTVFYKDNKEENSLTISDLKIITK